MRKGQGGFQIAVKIGFGNDAGGHISHDNVTSTYDAEKRIATANTPQGLFTYTYDSDGNRVQKSGSGSSRWDLAGGHRLELWTSCV